MARFEVLELVGGGRWLVYDHEVASNYTHVAEFTDEGAARSLCRTLNNCSTEERSRTLNTLYSFNNAMASFRGD